MRLEVKKERDTPLLSRKRVTLMAEYDGTTPSRINVRKEVAKKLGAKENLVVIKHIYTRFGSSKSKIITHVYNNEGEMKKLENEGLLAKHDPNAKKKEAKPAEGEAETPKAEEKKEAPAEKPAEKKEEPKKEEAKAEEKPAETKKEAPKEEKK